MTTLKAMVRKPRTDGFYSVYIRIVHNRKPGYIKTNKIVDAEHITSNGELTDPVVNEYCAMLIRQYTDRLNRTDVSLWGIKEVLESFFVYARFQDLWENAFIKRYYANIFTFTF